MIYAKDLQIGDVIYNEDLDEMDDAQRADLRDDLNAIGLDLSDSDDTGRTVIALED
jgi:hypothetical protein